MKSSVSAYLIEKNEILLKAYQLLCLFFANQQISRIAHPENPLEPLKRLETRFLFTQVSTLLLEAAILFKTLDDQIQKSPESPSRTRYMQQLSRTNENYGPMLFDEHIDIRECCNKVIHATTFEPQLVEGETAHHKDYASQFGNFEREIQWHHLSGNVRITGQHKKEEWAYLIQIPEFVEALSFLLDDG